MNILIRPRDAVERAVRKYMESGERLTDKCSIISIYSKYGRSPVIDSVADSDWVLKLEFDDVEPCDLAWQPAASCDYVLFSQQQAEQVRDFFNKLKETRTRFEKLPLVVHCDAGVSRSGAVGLMANYEFNLRHISTGQYDQILAFYRNALFPNAWVGKCLAEAMYGDASVWDKVRCAYTTEDDWRGTLEV